MSFDNPLMPVVGAWNNKIQAAIRFKDKRFGPDAREGMNFFVGPYSFLYGAKARQDDKHFRQGTDDELDGGEIPPPHFQMTVNKVAELVQLFGPSLYHKNPIRQVNPRETLAPDNDLMMAFGQDPGAQLYLQSLLMQGQQQKAVDSFRAKLLSQYLNYTPNALDLKTESRNVIDEAIIKGMGVLWTEVYTTPSGKKLVGSFYDTVDNLVIDPDMPTLRSAKWVARRRTEPVWEAERRFGLQPGKLRPQCESQNQQADTDASADGGYMRATGQTNDLITYWEVYSKTGLGGRLKGIDGWISQSLEVYGDFCYLAVCEGCPCPLNIPDEVYDLPEEQATAEIYRRVQWPTPYWADDDWPFTAFLFHTIPGDPWPMSHLAPGMGELKFLNWAYSYIAGKIRLSSRDFIAILEEAGQEITDIITRGVDYEILKIKSSHGKTIDQIVQFLQHPQFNNDIWHVIEAVADQFERRVGLVDLMYGQSARQDRSATESQTKRDAMNIRPDDMANKVEDAMSDVARKEAIAIRWHLQGQDVASILGPVGAALWDQFITPSEPSEILYSLEYRIEAGSVRKPNRDRDAANAQSLMTALMPFSQQLAVQVGMTDMFNSLVTMWCQTNDQKVDGLLIQAPPPMPAPAPAGGPGTQPPAKAQ